MEAIESEFLKRNVYEYFKYCYLEKNVCGAGIITSKQFVFYTQTDKYDHRTHDEIYMQIEQAIHIASKTEKRDAILPFDVYLAAVDFSLFIYLPDSQEFTYSQFVFLNDVLNQVEKFNQEVGEKPKIKLWCYKSPNLDELDVESVREKLKEWITQDFTIEEELIIGTTLPKKVIKETMQMQLGINNCKTISDVLVMIARCEKYKSDSYFQPYFQEILEENEQLKQKIAFLTTIGNKDLPFNPQNSPKEDITRKVQR